MISDPHIKINCIAEHCRPSAMCLLQRNMTTYFNALSLIVKGYQSKIKKNQRDLLRRNNPNRSWAHSPGRQRSEIGRASCRERAENWEDAHVSNKQYRTVNSQR